MVTGSKKKVEKLRAQGELYQCPSCGYQDGFHVSFKWINKRPEGEVYLICPNCHNRFRLGWYIPTPKSAS